MTSQPFTVTTSSYVALRSERGVLTRSAVRRARWNLTTGGRVVLAVHGMTSWEAGAPEHVGAMLAEAGVTVVFVQASAHPSLVADFIDAFTEAARQYLAVAQ